jgi:hypothetical protein
MRPGFLRADGISLQFALSVAYGIPASRIIAPEWVAETRCSIVAETSPEDGDLFRELFLDELKSRFHVNARIESRSFDCVRLASAVQAILARPVLNEIGIAGGYRIDFAWGEDRVATLTAALRKPDGAASVLTQVGRLTSGAPRGFRRPVSRASPSVDRHRTGRPGPVCAGGCAATFFARRFSASTKIEKPIAK